ncbi:hypothetical protein SNE26_20690 [Mucilaginibacter sp. cycad4]|uniref:hypothetical protein n=1 Tax=Mucilaginibacter sp. cycad4 TaxID=3342096 RepID=UPI002AABB16E|nr:hypothetical protein [Mucilaginibacter gossypii]WPU98447.1 hypothetical protein SNE26_20690 [Mucilaginibacter gossypii]
MKKTRFPRVALENFRSMAPGKLKAEIESSKARLAILTPRNHKEELLIAGNWKRIGVLQVILEHQQDPELEKLLGPIAVLVD